MQPVSDVHRVWQQLAHRGPIRGERVDHHRLDGRCGVAEGSQPVGERGLGAALEHVPQPRRLQVHDACHEPAGPPERRLVDAEAPGRRGGEAGLAASFAPAAAATASHAVCQLTRNDLATAAVERSNAAAATPWRSRSVSRLRAGTFAEDSVKVSAQPGVSQRKLRLCHTSTTDT